ncbi:MAG: hypothetical protein DA408_04640 [Bacteroidetes bacterium]|nr:MAG: hypothetical protein DA408_04640 [Bacteroidota bacterium]
MPNPINNRSQLLGFPRSYAFVIGINHYPKINKDLKSAVNDAREIARVLKYQQGFDHVELFLGVDPAAPATELTADLAGIHLQLDANGDTLRDLLQRIQDPALEPHITPQDCIVFYYAGHGKPGEFGEGPAGYLLPSDARPEKAMLENSSLLAMETVFETLKILDCHHTLLILDCCFAGKFRHVVENTRDAGWVTNMPLYEERFSRFKRERAWQVLVSAGPHQTAADWIGIRSELDEQRHSPFAEALIEALEGKAELKTPGRNLGDGVLTSQELFLYLWDKIERVTNDGNFGAEIQYPDLFPMGNHQGGQFIFFDPHNKLNFAQRVLRNPYKGLSPFETTDFDLFFGRRAAVRELLNKLRQTPILVVTAPSGSGKSSLVKAGLLPALRAWKNDNGQQEWEQAELLVLCPGAQAWTGAVATHLAADGTSLGTYYTGLEALLPNLDPTKKQVLLIDQYEAFFNDCSKATERLPFENKLTALLQQADQQNLKIIITLRSDFEWQLEESDFGQTFWTADNLGTFLYRVPPIGMAELREALVNPALAELYDFETEKLVNTILAEVNNAPGALPVLSFMMSRFYEVTSEDTRIFTEAAYKKLGGINGALSQYADNIYEELGTISPTHQLVMRKLILRMIQVNEGDFGRRRVYVRPAVAFQEDKHRDFINEFDYPGQQNAIVEEVLHLLEKKQLIIGGHDKIGAYYEPLHDALIQYWKTAKQWIADFGPETLRLQRQLWEAVVDSSQPQAAPVFSYGATAADGFEVDERLTANFSKRWDANPRLMQLIEQVSNSAKTYVLAHKDEIIARALAHIAPEDHDLFTTFWNDCHHKGELPDLNSLILSGYSEQLLAIYLEKGQHWLNQAEANFVRESWRKRIEDILDLKRQRDEAIQAKKEAQGAACTAKARQFYSTNPTLALNLAMAAHRYAPNEESLAALHDILSEKGSIFYRQTLRGHTDTIYNVAVAPDGQSFLTGSKDNTAKLWDQTGAEIRHIDGHTAPVFGVAFAPDGQSFLTGSSDNTAKLWNLPGQLLLTLQGHTDAIFSVAVAPDGQSFLTGSGDHSAKWWDSKGKEIRQLTGHTRRVSSVDFAPDGQSFLTGSDDKTAILWDTQGKEIHRLEGHAGPVFSVAFAPDGQTLATASTDGTVKLWTLKGENNLSIPAHKGPVYSVVFAPDGQSLLSGGVDKVAKLWNLQGEELLCLQGHTEHVSGLAFSPDGQSILTGSADHTARLWNREALLIRNLTESAPAIADVAFAPDGQTVLVGGADKTARLVTLTGTERLCLQGHQDNLSAVAFTPDGKTLLTGSDDKTAKAWTLQGKEIFTLAGHNGPIFSVACSADEQFILTGSEDKTAKLWTLKGKEILTLKGHKEAVFSVAFAPDGKTLLTGSRDKTAKLWDLKGKKIRELKGHSGSVYSVAFAPDGQSLLTGSRDKTARLWDLQRNVVRELQGHTAAVYRVAFSPDGQYLLTGSDDKKAKLWNLHGETLVTFQGHTKRVTSVVFAPDGLSLLTGSLDGSVKCWHNFFARWEKGVVWEYLEKLTATELAQHRIDWDY